MEELLTPVKTVTRDDQSLLRPSDEQKNNAKNTETEPKSQPDGDPSSPDYILGILRSKPDRDQLYEVLHTLDPANKAVANRVFDIRVPGPTTAQILQILVSTTIPDHWNSLEADSGSQASQGQKRKDPKLRGVLLRCLSSVAGISSLVSQLRTLLATHNSVPEHDNGSGRHLVIRDILAVLSALLKPEDFLVRLYTDICALHGNATQQQVAWRELISLVAAGRVLSTAAEALTSIKDLDNLKSISWVGEGASYASWLGRNIRHMATKIDTNNQEAYKSVALITGRAMSLGYIDQFVRELYSGLLGDQDCSTRFGLLLDNLRGSEQTTVLEVILRDVEKNYFSGELSTGSIGENLDGEVIGGVAALCSSIISNRPLLEGQIKDWLSTGRGSIQTIGLRRALFAVFSDREDTLMDLFTKSLENFGDKFYIKHTPMQIQEANAQAVLLAAGYVSRTLPTSIREIGRSSLYLNAVSNRLAASSTRARFFGMIVGMAISQQIEEPGKAMKFDLEEVESKEAQWYMNLVNIKDSVGSVEALKLKKRDEPQRKPKEQKKAPSSQPSTGSRPQPDTQTSKAVSIEEISDDSEKEEDGDDLIPYEKPDTDPEDSEDDPTLIQRNKPKTPVYIRDLIAALRDTDNVDRYHLGIKTAPSLIRRKIGFGTELAEQVEELALVIVGLQDNYKLQNFHELRLQSMIALLVSQPLKMGRWFTITFFDADLSQAQRSAVLTAIGLSARELAGYGEEDAKSMGLPALPDTSFPSKKLPEHVQAMYLADESPIEKLTKRIAQQSLQPLAANAADALTGPNALKVRTFSSRLDVEKRRQQREAQRKKSTLKDLHKVLTEGYFYPLTGRFGMMMTQSARSTSPSYNPFLTPHLLRLFLQTLTLILSTLGPHTPALPNLTQETLTLLISLHTLPVATEPTILPALLSLFLAVLDLNVQSGSSGEERLVTEHATQVMELREWVGEVFDRAPVAKGKGKDKDAAASEEEQVKMLSAGIMVMLGEVLERYQGRLMGVNVGFKY